MSHSNLLSVEYAPGAVSQTACFSVHGTADPGLLPRVAELWAKRGLTPARWHSALCGPGDGELYVDIEARGMGPATK